MIKTEPKKTGIRRINSIGMTPSLNKPSIDVAKLSPANTRHITVSFQPGKDVVRMLPHYMKAIVDKLCETIGVEPFNIAVKGYGLSNPEKPHLHFLCFIRKNRCNGHSWKTLSKESVRALEVWSQENLEGNMKITQFFDLEGWLSYVEGPRNLANKKIGWLGFEIPPINEKLIINALSKENK
ncbi:MAG: hypothetical protein JZU49_00350 [Sulfuricurvum sp.]|nr:hypothetical protein [Sulfuricurvum sp.]